ncbi:MAG: hypothetical protein ACOC8S_05440, partial [Bacteroidota bacterium]
IGIGSQFVKHQTSNIKHLTSIHNPSLIAHHFPASGIWHLISVICFNHLKSNIKYLFFTVF